MEKCNPLGAKAPTFHPRRVAVQATKIAGTAPSSRRQVQRPPRSSARQRDPYHNVAPTRADPPPSRRPTFSPTSARFRITMHRSFTWISPLVALAARVPPETPVLTFTHCASCWVCCSKRYLDPVGLEAGLESYTRSNLVRNDLFGPPQLPRLHTRCVAGARIASLRVSAVFFSIDFIWPLLT